MGRQTDSPPSLKKRKQLSMDDYPNMASFNPPSILFFFLFSFERCCVDKIVPDFVLQGKRKK
jgi:SWI/SNF-related matrix-associated actin-dependent regulator of chromatin subfamily A member 5